MPDSRGPPCISCQNSARSATVACKRWGKPGCHTGQQQNRLCATDEQGENLRCKAHGASQPEPTALSIATFSAPGRTAGCWAAAKLVWRVVPCFPALPTRCPGLRPLTSLLAPATTASAPSSSASTTRTMRTLIAAAAPPFVEACDAAMALPRPSEMLSRQKHKPNLKTRNQSQSHIAHWVKAGCCYRIGCE